VYWTGEMSHHEILACTAKGGIVVLCEHSNTERPFLKLFAKKFESTNSPIKLKVSKLKKDPIQIY